MSTCGVSRQAAAPAKTSAERLPRLADAYRSEQAADGTWNIFDVPVYADEKIIAPASDANGQARIDKAGRIEMAEYNLNRAWLEGSVQTAATRRAGGYLPPLHVNHHGSAETRHAGVFVLRRVATYEFEHVPRSILFADFLRVPDDVHTELKAGKLPYRSVEILDIRRSAEKAEVDSIALMADTVPRFRFPNLRIADERRLDAAARPALAHYAAADGSFAAVSCFQEGLMGTTGDAIAPAATSALAEMDTAKVEEHCKALCDAHEAIEQHCEALCDVHKAIEEHCKALCDALGIEMHEKEAETPKEGPAEPEETVSPTSAAAPAPIPVPPRRVANEMPPPESLRLLARVTALEGQLAIQAKERAIADCVGTTAQSLGDEGFSVDIKKLRMIAKEHGPKGVALFAAALREYAIPAPADGWDADLARDSRRPSEDMPEVAIYASGGPDQLQTARRLAALYASADSKFVRDAGYDLKTYLATNMGAPVNGTAAAK